MPCHHALSEMLHAYVAAAGIADDRKGWLFRTSPGHNATVLTEQPMNQTDGWRMVRRRAAAAGIAAPIGNHTFRATGITNFWRTAARSNTRRTWPRTPARARPGSTTGGKSGSRRRRWRGFGCDCENYVSLNG